MRRNKFTGGGIRKWKKMKQASLTVGNTITLFMGVSVAVTAVLLLFVKPIVAVMSTPAEAVSGTRLYLTICFIGIPIAFGLLRNRLSNTFQK